MTELNKTLLNFETPQNLPLILTLVWVLEKIYASSSSSPVLIKQYATTKVSERNQNDIIGEVFRLTSQTTNIKVFLEAKRCDTYHFDDRKAVDEKLKLVKIDKAILFIDGIASFG